jgi:type IV pilus assembly protein PilC
MPNAGSNLPPPAGKTENSARRLLATLLTFVLPVRKTKPKSVATPATKELVGSPLPLDVDLQKKPTKKKHHQHHRTAKVASKSKKHAKHNKHSTHSRHVASHAKPALSRLGSSAAERHQARIANVQPAQPVAESDKHGLLDLEFLETLKAKIMPTASEPTGSSPVATIPVESAPHTQEMDVEFTDQDHSSKPVDEDVLRREVEAEGFLESARPDSKQSVATMGKGSSVAIAGEQPTEDIKTIKKRLKEQAKKEREQEILWEKEAAKREKQEREQAAKKKDEVKKEEQGPLKYKLPEIKKRSPIAAFFAGLNYMGLDRERISFIDNLATMMDAGLPLLDALRVLQKEARKGPMRKLLGRVLIAVETGSPLWRAMDGQYFFKPQQVAMVRVGEESGSLAQNLQYLAEQEEKDRTLKGKVKTAMIYPTIVLVMLTVIVFGLGLFVLPQLVQVIQSLGVPLPLVTRIIITFTDVFTTHTQAILLSFAAGVITFILLNKFTSFKVLVEWCMYKIPGIGTLIREATLSRFGVVMGGLLRAGVPITEALDSLAKATNLTRYRSFYEELLEHIQLGDAFATSFEKVKKTDKCFPVSMQQLIITGEQSGSLTKIMFKIAQIHEKRASEVAEKLPVIIEPMLLLIMGGLVGTIALGVLAPIYSVVGNIGV